MTRTHWPLLPGQLHCSDRDSHAAAAALASGPWHNLAKPLSSLTMTTDDHCMMVRASVTVVAELEDTISFHPDDKSVCKLGSLVEELELAAPKLRFGLGSDSESSRRIRSLNPGESNLNVDLGRNLPVS